MTAARSEVAHPGAAPLAHAHGQQCGSPCSSRGSSGARRQAATTACGADWVSGIGRHTPGRPGNPDIPCARAASPHQVLACICTCWVGFCSMAVVVMATTSRGAMCDSKAVGTSSRSAESCRPSMGAAGSGAHTSCPIGLGAPPCEGQLCNVLQGCAQGGGACSGTCGTGRQETGSPSCSCALPCRLGACLTYVAILSWAMARLVDTSQS